MGIVVRDVVESVAEIVGLKITVPSDVSVRCRIADERISILIQFDFVAKWRGVDVKRRTISGQDEIIRLNESHVGRRNHSQCIEERLKCVDHPIPIPFGAVFIFVSEK